MIADNAHTTFVRIARIALPVIALSMLSTVFLLARAINPDDAIPFAEVDVSMRARDQQLTAPRFAGMSGDGTGYALSAAFARPDPGDPRRMSASEVDLSLTDRSGAVANVRARTGTVDTGAREIVLEGDVRIDTSTGYRLRTSRVEGSLAQLNIAAIDGVAGDGPLGTLRAGALHLSEDENGDGRLVFAGGVELRYLPPAE